MINAFYKEKENEKIKNKKKTKEKDKKKTKYVLRSSIIEIKSFRSQFFFFFHTIRSERIIWFESHTYDEVRDRKRSTIDAFFYILFGCVKCAYPCSY